MSNKTPGKANTLSSKLPVASSHDIDATHHLIDSTSCDGEDAATQKPDATMKTPYDDLYSVMTPYLTCQRCNSIAFVDVRRVRQKEDQLASNLPGESEDTTNLYEQVPKCPGCGSTRYLRAGVVSFQEQIEEERNAIKEFERRRVPATALIQRIARGFLGRLEFRRRLVERERFLRKINLAATKLQARVRGMQAWRRTVIERCLQIIRFMAPPILMYALAARPNEPPVFWYTNTAEINVFYWNYREYVRRSGGKPTLIKVENNVLEITRRVLRREHALVSRIQARWRGLTTRMIFREFKQQKGWLKGIQQSPAVKIQRLFRGHESRRFCRALQGTIKYPAQREAYRREMAARKQQAKAVDFRERLLAKYKYQLQIKRTTRMMVHQVKLPLSSRSSAMKYVGESVEDEEDESDLGPETHSHIQHSLKTATSSNNRIGSEVRDTKTVSTDNVVADESKPWGGLKPPRNPNAVRFADIKRQLQGKHGRVRGPRLDILKAQMYTVSTTGEST